VLWRTGGCTAAHGWGIGAGEWQVARGRVFVLQSLYPSVMFCKPFWRRGYGGGFGEVVLENDFTLV